MLPNQIYFDVLLTLLLERDRKVLNADLNVTRKKIIFQIDSIKTKLQVNRSALDNVIYGDKQAVGVVFAEKEEMKLAYGDLELKVLYIRKNLKNIVIFFLPENNRMCQSEDVFTAEAIRYDKFQDETKKTKTARFEGKAWKKLNSYCLM